jgi:hypothetical protein
VDEDAGVGGETGECEGGVDVDGDDFANRARVLDSVV